MSNVLKVDMAVSILTLFQNSSPKQLLSASDIIRKHSTVISKNKEHYCLTFLNNADFY